MGGTIYLCTSFKRSQKRRRRRHSDEEVTEPEQSSRDAVGSTMVKEEELPHEETSSKNHHKLAYSNQVYEDVLIGTISRTSGSTSSSSTTDSSTRDSLSSHQFRVAKVVATDNGSANLNRTLIRELQERNNLTR